MFPDESITIPDGDENLAYKADPSKYPYPLPANRLTVCAFDVRPIKNNVINSIFFNFILFHFCFIINFNHFVLRIRDINPLWFCNSIKDNHIPN